MSSTSTRRCFLETRSFPSKMTGALSQLQRKKNRAGNIQGRAGNNAGNNAGKKKKRAVRFFARKADTLLLRKCKTLQFCDNYFHCSTTKMDQYRINPYKIPNNLGVKIFLNKNVFKVHLTPKYFFRLNKSLHLFETHYVFLN